MKEYRIENMKFSNRRTENLLNELSLQGWEIKFIKDSFILLERDRK